MREVYNAHAVVNRKCVHVSLEVGSQMHSLFAQTQTRVPN